MPRVYCQECHRPEKTCICSFSVNINNHIHVVILQHPSETKQSKGTVSLLQLSLMHFDVIIGENFTRNDTLLSLLSRYGNNIALLFPSEDAITIDHLSVNSLNIDTEVSTISAKGSNKSQVECIVILDGTWKKAYRMFMVTPCLHKIMHFVLPEGIESLYHIRKTKKENALSSLEACCHALALLENDNKKYQLLLDKFVKFNEFQQTFMY